MWKKRWEAGLKLYVIAYYSGVEVSDGKGAGRKGKKKDD